MSLKKKPTAAPKAAMKKGVFSKNVNRTFLLKITSIALVIIFCGISSIKAQIEGDLYGQQTGDIAGVSSLMLAVSNNDLDGVKFFSRAGGFLINQKNIGGATALHIAARNGNSDIANILLENGADANIADNEGWTPLMRAAISGNEEIVENLLTKGANAGALNSNNETVLIHATLADCSDCLNHIFTKSDLLKNMDIKLLKEQLIDAFIIARNRENEMTQNLLESYLDRVTKLSPLITKPEVTKLDSNSDAADGSSSAPTSISSIPAITTQQKQQEFISQNGEIKYILIDEENQTSSPITEKTAPIATVIAPIVAPLTSSQQEEISAPIIPIIKSNKSSANSRFKFVVGAPGIAVSDNNNNVDNNVTGNVASDNKSGNALEKPVSEKPVIIEKNHYKFRSRI